MQSITFNDKIELKVIKGTAYEICGRRGKRKLSLSMLRKWVKKKIANYKNCRLQMLAAIILIVTLLLSGCMRWVPYERGGGSQTHSNSPLLSGFTASEDALVAGRQCEILFTVEASSIQEEVVLCDSDEQIAQMNDNGQNGDLVAGDGIYSVALLVTSDGQEEQLQLYAQTGSVISETVEIRVFDMPTQQEAQQTEQIISALQEIQLQYSGQDGFVLEGQMDTLLNQVEAFAQEGKEQGMVAEVIKQEDAVEIWLTSGLPIMFVPEMRDSLGGTQQDQMKLVTLEPFYSEFSQMGKTYREGVDQTAANVAETLAGYQFDEQFDYDEEEVTTDVIEKLGKNQIILWYGHGGFNSKYHSYLATGEAFDADAYHNDSDYYEKYVQGYFMVSDGRLAVTSKYIDRYCGEMDHSLVFLTTCKSGQSDRLANAFLKKGAVAVLGYDRTVLASYGINMLQSVIENMLLYDSETNSYTTLLKALQLAQQQYGETDAEFYDEARTGAKLLIFGGQEAENYQLCSEVMVKQTPQPSHIVTPTLEIPQQIDTQEEAHQAYRQFLQNYEWVSYCPSDLSEISPEEYDRYWMGKYALADIDQNGIDELVIMAGQSVADTSHTFFTYQNGAIQYVGSLFCGASSLYQSTNGRGAVLCEHHGGLGKDVYIDLMENQISVLQTEEYNYESSDYVDGKAGSFALVPSYNVNDLSAFS